MHEFEGDTYNFCTTQVGAAEAVHVAGLLGLGTLQLGSILDIGKSPFDFLLFVRRILA